MLCSDINQHNSERFYLLVVEVSQCRGAEFDSGCGVPVCSLHVLLRISGLGNGWMEPRNFIYFQFLTVNLLRKIQVMQCRRFSGYPSHQCFVPKKVKPRINLVCLFLYNMTCDLDLLSALSYD